MWESDSSGGGRHGGGGSRHDKLNDRIYGEEDWYIYVERETNPPS